MTPRTFPEPDPGSSPAGRSSLPLEATTSAHPPSPAASRAVSACELILGAFVLIRIVRSRRAQTEAPPLTAAERERAARLLAGDSGKDPS